MALAGAFRAASHDSLRGRLRQLSGNKSALETASGKLVEVRGDEPTTGVLNDRRLAGQDLELIGERKSTDLFLVDPIHTKAMFVHKDGKRYFITYWCDICSIRTYTPGKCWCCQEETRIDLRERLEP